tara:strand:+ start:274 stop:705 length:432 start_codon:yes stop_codon:yes gene_type:complete
MTESYKAGYMPKVSLKLFTGSGENIRVPVSSGLNWGQRRGRDENQAYLAIPADIQNSGFFPKRGTKFRVQCDDGFEIECVIAQANGKALHSIPNSVLGKYFRQRLNLKSGEFVVLYHLEQYGRLWVDLYKKSNLEFLLDFSDS